MAAVLRDRCEQFNQPVSLAPQDSIRQPWFHGEAAWPAVSLSFSSSSASLLLLLSPLLLLSLSLCLVGSARPFCQPRLLRATKAHSSNVGAETVHIRRAQVFFFLFPFPPSLPPTHPPLPNLRPPLLVEKKSKSFESPPPFFPLPDSSASHHLQSIFHHTHTPLNFYSKG